MTKTILITGATDGIGLLTAQTLAAQGHSVLLHGRSARKLAEAQAQLDGAPGYLADLSSLADTRKMAQEVLATHDHIDVLINNAGVYKTGSPRLPDGQDVRFVVNTLAPYLLTQMLLPVIPADGRVINLSSAAQAPVDLAALRGEVALDHMPAYAQSKHAITLWSAAMAEALPNGPVVMSVNPGSLLATKMVKEGFGVAGNDLSIGSGILCRLALEEEFASASGRYWDNDAGGFGHVPTEHAKDVTDIIEQMIA